MTLWEIEITKKGYPAMTPKTVALLVGGWSAERQVSLTKGKAVEAALLEAGYEVRVVDVKKDLPALIAALTPRPDAVFNNLYGQGGEDGEIQSVLEILEIPYTHSGVLASAIGMNKPVAKALSEKLGVRCPQGKTVPAETLDNSVMSPPYVVKPPCEGSSVGVVIVMDHDSNALSAAASSMRGDVLVEQYVPGREITVAILDGKAQGVTEIVSHTPFFDYEAKYSDARTEYVLPAQINDKAYETAMDWAARIYNGIGCAGIARCDFRLDDSLPGDDGLYFLEINTQPGLTAESIGPSQVIKNGMSFSGLCAHLVETARCHGAGGQG
jgi:D-alanine-D-alanine ligase